MCAKAKQRREAPNSHTERGMSWGGEGNKRSEKKGYIRKERPHGNKGNPRQGSTVLSLLKGTFRPLGYREGGEEKKEKKRKKGRRGTKKKEQGGGWGPFSWHS